MKYFWRSLDKRSQKIIKSISKSLPNFTCAFMCFTNFKKICKVKKSSSRTVWHNSLAKSRSNLHQESWEKQNYVCVLPPLENIHQESFSILYFFSPSHHLQGNDDDNHDLRAYMCAGTWVCQVSIFAKLVCQTVGGQFFLFLLKLDGWQVNLTNYWSCPNPLPLLVYYRLF
jgi:hypothetical protein